MILRITPIACSSARHRLAGLAEQAGAEGRHAGVGQVAGEGQHPRMQARNLVDDDHGRPEPMR
jgi:hypothetical protein